METSLETAKVEKNGKIAKTIGYYISFIALGLTSAALGPTIPGLAEHTRTSLSQISFLFTADSLGYLLGSLLGSRLYDRMPGHRVQVIALLITVAMLALIPIVPLLWLLIAIMIVFGFAKSMVDVGGNTLLVWVHRDRVAPFMNGLHLFFGVGAFLCPVIIAQAVLLSGNILWAYWALAVLLVPVIVYLGRLPSPPIQAGHRDGQEARVNYWLVTLIILFFFLNVGAEGSFGGWVFTYAKALNLANDVTAAYLTSAFWGGLTVGRLIAIPVSVRVHPRWMLLADVIGCIASLLLIVFTKASFTAAWIAAVGFGMFMASVFPTTITLAERYLPINGRVTGLFFVGSSTGSMFFPWLIGQLFEPAGPRSSMIIILAAMVAALVLFGVMLLSFKEEA